MWLLGGFWRVFRGFWRLLVGLVIGAILYVWTFFNYKVLWEDIHHRVTNFMEWLMVQPMLADYSQWSTLLNMDDKLTFALYILVGRTIWMLVESIFITFPFWLLFGRQKENRQAELASGGTSSSGASSYGNMEANQGRSEKTTPLGESETGERGGDVSAVRTMTEPSPSRAVPVARQTGGSNDPGTS